MSGAQRSSVPKELNLDRLFTSPKSSLIRKLAARSNNENERKCYSRIITLSLWGLEQGPLRRGVLWCSTGSSEVDVATCVLLIVPSHSLNGWLYWDLGSLEAGSMPQGPLSTSSNQFWILSLGHIILQVGGGGPLGVVSTKSAGEWCKWNERPKQDPLKKLRLFIPIIGCMNYNMSLFKSTRGILCSTDHSAAPLQHK